MRRTSAPRHSDLSSHDLSPFARPLTGGCASLPVPLTDRACLQQAQCGIPPSRTLNPRNKKALAELVVATREAGWQGE